MPEGSQTELPYSRTGRTSPLYADYLTSCGHADKLRVRKPRVLLAFVQILLTCVFHFISNCYAKIFDIFYVIKDRSLYIIGSIDLFDPFPCNLHDIAFDWLESHAPFPCPTSKTI